MSTRRAFTLVELAAAVAATGSLLALVTQPLAEARQSARKAKDATHVRGIHQSFIVFSSNNRDQFPLPSKLDRQNTTVAAVGRAKDTTANIYSMCIFAGMFPSEMLISPGEVNRKIRALKNYEYSTPRAAVTPASALWDPALSVDFTAGNGHASYAHLQPAGDRLNRWAATFNADEPVITLRGPEIAKVERGAATLAGIPVTPTLATRDSNTLKIFGDGNAWAGNVAMADNSVHFITRYAAGETLTPERSPVYTTKDNTKVVDLWNHDEQDDPASTNNMLGIFTTAGDKPADYKVIWD